MGYISSRSQLTIINSVFSVSMNKYQRKRLVDMKINANILLFNDTKLNDMIKKDFYRVYYIFISL